MKTDLYTKVALSHFEGPVLIEAVSNQVEEVRR